MNGLISSMATRLALFAALVTSAAGHSQTLPDQSADKTLGVVNCSSSLCHGSVNTWQSSPVAQNEYVVWSRLDKHARAYNVLLNERSRSIASKLGLAKPAHESKECLDCHAHNPVAERVDTRHKITDGVTCEGCHGPSEKWIAGHTAPGVKHADNLAHGLYPSAAPQARAKLCMSCHFGTADKYVNHRTMAAGHPRLSFELTTFTNLQPAHFTVDKDYTQRKGTGASNHAKIWALGQALAVSTQMDILVDPVRGRDGVFPEPTLFDCHACHHPMADQRWKPRTAFGTSIAPGLIRLNDANALMLRLILRQLDTDLYTRFNQAAQDLNKALAGNGKLNDKALALRQQAQAASEKITASAFDGGTLRAMALLLIDDGLSGLYPDYSGAEQATMALGSLSSAMQQTGTIKNPTAYNKGLAQLRAVLVKDEAYKPTEFVSRLREFRPLVAAR
ncbi:MAG: multiheme c-type cytochrome [Pseudomonadota bacterium]